MISLVLAAYYTENTLNTEKRLTSINGTPITANKSKTIASTAPRFADVDAISVECLSESKRDQWDNKGNIGVFEVIILCS